MQCRRDSVPTWFDDDSIVGMALSRKIWSRVALAVSSGAAVGFAATSALRTYTAQTTEKDLLWAEETSSLPETLKKYATRAPIVLEPSSVYGWGHALNLFGLGPKQITTPTKVRDSSFEILAF